MDLCAFNFHFGLIDFCVAHQFVCAKEREREGETERIECLN